MWPRWVCSSNHSQFCGTDCSIGPLITMGFIYHLIGLLISLVIREIFWVPHRFRSGIIVAGVWSNFGDIRESITIIFWVKWLKKFASYCGNHEYHCQRALPTRRHRSRCGIHFCIHIGVLGKRMLRLISLEADGLVFIIDYSISDRCSYPDCKGFWWIRSGR